MSITTTLAATSQTVASNGPDGTVDAPSTLDDAIRYALSFIATLRDGKGYTNPITLASAATTDIGLQNSFAVEITGTTTITSFGTNYNGPRFLRFTGALILTHAAATLNLPGGANITTVVGDTCLAYPNAGATGWNVVSYQKNTAFAAPAFSAYQSTLQSFPNAAFAKVLLQTKEFDTASAFDAVTNYRFTPLVAGYYQVSGCFNLTSSAAAVIASIFKNGAEFKRGNQYGTAAGSGAAADVSALVFLNGTTDYLELFGFQSSGAAINTATGVPYTYFQAFLARAQ